MGRVIAEVATELDRTQQRRERLGAEIGKLFEAHPFGLILGSLPGVGPRTGARMLAEIGDIASRTDRGWPATPALPRSPASPAAASGARPGAAAAITGSRTRCTSPPSPRCATPSRGRSTTASGPRERNTPQPSSASRVVAATSSWPCCARANRTAPRRLLVTGRLLPDAAPAVPDQWRWPLTKKMGTPPRGRDQLVCAPPLVAAVTRRR